MKYWLLYVLIIANLTACEQQKQTSAEVGAVPKEILDKATSDIQNAEALTAQNLKVMENLDAPREAE